MHGNDVLQPRQIQQRPEARGTLTTAIRVLTDSNGPHPFVRICAELVLTRQDSRIAGLSRQGRQCAISHPMLHNRTGRSCGAKRRLYIWCRCSMTAKNIVFRKPRPWFCRQINTAAGILGLLAIASTAVADATSGREA